MKMLFSNLKQIDEPKYPYDFHFGWNCISIEMVRKWIYSECLLSLDSLIHHLKFKGWKIKYHNSIAFDVSITSRAKAYMLQDDIISFFVD
jgi:hypothetical protein